MRRRRYGRQGCQPLPTTKSIPWGKKQYFAPQKSIFVTSKNKQFFLTNVKYPFCSFAHDDDQATSTRLFTTAEPCYNSKKKITPGAWRYQKIFPNRNACSRYYSAPYDAKSNVGCFLILLEMNNDTIRFLTMLKQMLDICLYFRK